MSTHRITKKELGALPDTRIVVLTVVSGAAKDGDAGPSIAAELRIEGTEEQLQEMFGEGYDALGRTVRLEGLTFEEEE